MKVRGERECNHCGQRWSYYETGSVECPVCGSLRSVGVDDPSLHTASQATLDVGLARRAVGTEPTETVATKASDAAAAFTRQHGFVDAGELQPLDRTFLAATELRHVGEALGRALRISDAEEQYLLALIDGVEANERPPTDDLPSSLESVYGLAMASAVGDYRRDLRRYLAEQPDAAARRTLGVLEDHRTRIELLDGNVAPATADALVTAARSIGEYLIADETSLESARGALATLDPG